MKLLRIIIIAALTAGVSLLTSCRDELCYDHYPSVSLGLEWEHEWERDYGMNHASNWDEALHGFGYDEIRPERPEWVRLLINKSDGTVGERILSSDGGDVKVDLGEGQSYLLYNGDTEYILLSDMASLTNAQATASSRSRAGLSLADMHPGARSTNPPDVLYAAYVENAPSPGYHEHPSLQVKMQPLVYTYVIRYEFDEGQEFVSLARGALGGMAEGVYLRDGRTSENTSIILYDCEVKDYGCEAHVRSFGVPGFPDQYFGREDNEKNGTTSEKPYTLNLELLLKNGKMFEFNFDISAQLKNQPRGGVITVKGVKISDEQGMSESGFDVEVTEWPNHDVIDLPIEIDP